MKANLLWMDLEMTGLDEKHDKILEVAVIATDWNFKKIAQYEAVIKVSPRLLKKRLVGDFWEENSKTRDQLIAQNNSGKSTKIIEQELLGFVKKNFGKNTVYLAGNSIYNDRKFIAKEWKILNQKLHYRMLDVTAWKLIFENKFDIKFNKPGTHRAMSDIEGSIMELEKYLKKVKK